jgi:predicted transcriptional regulator
MHDNTRAKDIMSTELVVGQDNMTVEEAIKLLVNNRITGFPVVDRTNRLVGVVSELDVIKTIQRDGTEATAIDLQCPIEFTRKVHSIPEDTSWNDILRTFMEKKVRRLPVIDREGRLKGIITRRDIMKALFYSSNPSVARKS